MPYLGHSPTQSGSFVFLDDIDIDMKAIIETCHSSLVCGLCSLLH